MQRREFLAAAALQPAAPRRIKIAFLGVAHGHARAKVQLVRDSPEWELAGVVPETPELTASFEKERVAFLTREQVLRDSSIEAVAVESAVLNHSTDGLAALAAGKHVHIEKPPAHRLADLRRMAETARKNGRLLQMGYMWRRHPGFARIFEAVRAGWLGQVYMVKGTINTLAGAAERAELARFEGGMMFEMGSHFLDPVVRLMGRPRRVTPFLRRHGAFADNLKDNAVVVLDFDNAMAVISSGGLQPYAMAHRSFEVLGAKGNAVLRPIEPPILEIELGEAAGPYKVGRQRVELPAYRRYVDDFAELARAIREGGRLGVSPEEELLVQEVLLEATQMKEGA
jgi:predicted dehydrogenase